MVTVHMPRMPWKITSATRNKGIFKGCFSRLRLTKDKAAMMMITSPKVEAK